MGGGWSGQIGGAGFNGEFSYFHSLENFTDSSGQGILSSGINYAFPNTLYLHFAFIYNSSGATGRAGQNSIFNSLRLTARTLSPARYNLFGETAYSITPLIRTSLATVYNPSDKSAYIVPSGDFSLKANLSLSLVAQLLFGATKSQFSRNFGSIYYIWMKWDF